MIWRSFIFFAIFCQNVLLQSPRIPTPLPEDAKLDFLGLSVKYGYPANDYDVVTEDGYILKLFQIPGTKGVPVLLMHGMSDTGDTWILRGNDSLAITLASAGYEVWVGNCRGNKYSRRHTNLNPDLDPVFWDFSFHEHGLFDLPAIIDTVLKVTDASKLNAIGHSQGNTIFYVLGSTRPEYNEKVNVLIALAPICYLHHTSPPLSTILKLTPTFNKIGSRLNLHEVFGYNSVLAKSLREVCSLPDIGYEICIENILFPIAGYDYKEISPEFFRILNAHFPSSSSRKNFVHFGQVYNRRTFARYDYGVIGNRANYNGSVPPVYDLREVTMPVAMIVGSNDKFTSEKDVGLLKKQLPDVVAYVVSPRKKFNHLDDVWGEHMKEYLFPHIFSILGRYN